MEAFVLHYYPHHIGDFIKDTSRLTDSQAMAYLRLIWLYYESESPLPNDSKLLAFKIGSDENTVEMLLQCYFYANALQWHHKRIDSVLLEYKNKSEKASESAKKRWSNAKCMRTHSESNANGMLNQEPITNNQEPKEKKERAKPLAIACPSDVSESVWQDWLNLRKSKRAPVTQTVLNHAISEAQIAGITLERFLIIWCARGSQGLEASWLKPSEKGAATAHTGFASKNYREGIDDDGRIL